MRAFTILNIVTSVSPAIRCKAPIRLCLVLFAVFFSRVCRAEAKGEPLVVVQNGKYGYIDHDGNVIIRPQFMWADDFWRGLGTVFVCGRYVSIDSSGALHPLRVALEGHLEPERKGEKFGFIDASGLFRIAPTFDEVLPFSEGLAAVRNGEKWGFVDTSGKIVIPPQFESAFYFREGVGTAELNSGYALIDTSGRVLAEGFDFLNFVNDGRVPASRLGEGSFLNLNGQVVIPFTYNNVNRFSDGLAAVEKDNKWGYVDRDGKVVIPLELDYAGEFGNGLAPAKVGIKTGFIDRTGKFAFFLDFDYAAGFLAGDEELNLFIADTDVSGFRTSAGLFGYVHSSGHVIWGPMEGSPDHAPLFGWSEEEKVESCKGFTESTRSTVASFPEH